MAITETRQFREPFVEAAGMGVVDKALPLLNTPLNTASYTGSQFVQGSNALETQAANAASGLNSLLGANAYQQFQSPYQQEVIDTSLAAMQREQQKGLGALRNQAYTAGAFGGGREAAMMGEYQASSDMARAMQESQMRQQGFQNAQQTALGQLQAQQGLGQYQTQLGGLQRQLGQADLSAQAEAAREAQFADYTQLGLVAPQLASVIGGFPAATQQQSTPPPSTSQQLLGLGIGGAGLMGAVERNVWTIIMSRILRRPMFRGGRVSSYGNGIATGLANGGMPNKRGFVDGPGGYAGKDILEYQEDFEERVPVKKGLSTGDYLRIASAGMDILGAPSEGGGIKGLLATAAKPLASLGTDLGSSMDKRAMSRDDRITNLSMAQAKLDTTEAQAFEKIERSKAVKLIFDGKISEIDKTLLDPRIANAVEGTDEYAAKVSLTKQRDNLIKTKERAELKILIPGKR